MSIETLLAAKHSLLFIQAGIVGLCAASWAGSRSPFYFGALAFNSAVFLAVLFT